MRSAALGRIHRVPATTSRKKLTAVVNGKILGTKGFIDQVSSAGKLASLEPRQDTLKDR